MHIKHPKKRLPVFALLLCLKSINLAYLSQSLIPWFSNIKKKKVVSKNLLAIIYSQSSE